ncbi:contact-dependent growth inhibition system immunity protein [Bacteroides sp. 519]|uniref:contact-dependent growth inhibition system immunity protein n=1 Tax=Bacteroides sp. 519 TaxID=2302937 RepID=UPI0013D1344F|nr:contact-dependent growth inhibition system immunity protein [Bacteroides sp. 519]
MDMISNKTLKELEKKSIEFPEDSSYLVRKVFELYNKKIKEFEVEDLRIMISQGFGLDYLIPIAINKLKENLFIEGDFYPGDLLESILSIKKEYWDANQSYKIVVIDLLINNIQKLDEVEISDKVKEDLRAKIESLISI